MRTQGAAWPCPHSWPATQLGGSRGPQNKIMNVTFISLWSGGHPLWLPFLPPPRWPPHGMRSKGSPAMPSLWEKGHRKRGWASDPRAPSQPHSPGGASGDPAGTFQSLPAHCAQAQLPLQHRGEEEGIGFCCHKQAPESHQLPGQGLAAEVPSAHGFTGWKSQCRGWSLSGRNPPPHP